MTVLTELALPPGDEAERVPSSVVAYVRSGKHRGGVADSSSGAGKPAGVGRAAVKLAALRIREEPATRWHGWRNLLKLPQESGEGFWAGRGWAWT